MVREPDATRQTTPHDIQLMSKHRVLSFKPQLRLERRGQDGQSETEQPDHSASLGDSFTASTRMRFSVHTASPDKLSASSESYRHDACRSRRYHGNRKSRISRSETCSTRGRRIFETCCRRSRRYRCS